MRKEKINLTLTAEARDILKQIAKSNGLSMSVVLEMLIRGNQGIHFMKGMKK